tara:strand:- start:103 stop:561 length:459 start_codon:yes stop_codon:yes gene_type:complete
MIKKITIYFIAIIFLSSCGFKPIYSNNEVNFYLSKIEVSGEKSINNQITSSLKTYKNKKNKDNKFFINVSSTKEKKIVAKDSKGNASSFKLTINSQIIVVKNDKVEKSKKFSEDFIYNNRNKKFELKQYEKNIQENLTNKIIENIILYLYEN